MNISTNNIRDICQWVLTHPERCPKAIRRKAAHVLDAPQPMGRKLKMSEDQLYRLLLKESQLLTSKEIAKKFDTNYSGVYKKINNLKLAGLVVECGCNENSVRQYRAVVRS